MNKHAHLTTNTPDFLGQSSTMLIF